MENHNAILGTIVIIIITAVIFVSIFKKFKISPILAYFLAGSILGEHGFHIIKSTQTEFFGEIGVAFLLFAIGSGLTFNRLKSLKYLVFGLGSLQIIVTAICTTLIALLLKINLTTSIIIGLSLAFSSTAIAMQLINEKEELRSETERSSISILLMQDFVVIPVIIIIPILNQENSCITTSITLVIIKTLCTIFVMFITGKLILKPIYKQIYKLSPSANSELFIATTLAIALGTSWITSCIGLSLELGAFISGVVIAEARLQEQAKQSIKPFQSLLLGLFFMTIGMTIDINILKENLIIILTSSVSIILIKIITITLLCKIFKLSTITSLKTGIFLSQVGEFAFIIFHLAESYNFITTNNYQLLLIITTSTMALTPIIINITYKFITNKIFLMQD